MVHIPGTSVRNVALIDASFITARVIHLRFPKLVESAATVTQYVGIQMQSRHR